MLIIWLLFMYCYCKNPLPGWLRWWIYKNIHFSYRVATSDGQNQYSPNQNQIKSFFVFCQIKSNQITHTKNALLIKSNQITIIIITNQIKSDQITPTDEHPVWHGMRPLYGSQKAWTPWCWQGWRLRRRSWKFSSPSKSWNWYLRDHRHHVRVPMRGTPTPRAQNW